MKRVLQFAALLLLALPACAQTPGFVYHRSNGQSSSGNGQSAPWFQVDPCVSGDTWFVPYNFASGSGVTSVTVSDDKGDTFAYAVAQPGKNDTNQVSNVAYVACTAGATKITITFAGGTPSFASTGFSVFYNVGAINGTGHSNSGTGTSATCASIGASGNLIYNYVVQDSGTLTQPGFTAGTGMTPLGNDLFSQGAGGGTQQFYQWRVAAAATNPGATLNSSKTWASICLAFAAATAGSAPSGEYIAHAVNIELPSSGSTSITVPFYLTGRAVEVITASGSTDTFNVPTDSQSNSWASCGGGAGNGAIGGGMAGHVQNLCICNATASNSYTVNIVRSASTNGDHVQIVDIAGADTTSAQSCADTRQTQPSGNQTIAGTISLPSYTPATSSEIIFGVLGVDANTVATYAPLSSPAGIFDCTMPNPTQANDPNCENDGWFHFYSNSTSAETWTVNEAVESMAYGNWASITVGIKAPAAAVTTQGMALTGVGD